MPDVPLVSVMTMVYNRKIYLLEAINSLINQTFKNYELLIIDNGSTDGSFEIAQEYAKANPKIRVYQRRNATLSSIRNFAIDLSRGHFCAVADSDDVYHPQRLERQIHFLNHHQEIGVCGTWVETIGTVAGRQWKRPSNDEMIRCFLLFENALAHSSVMWRKELFSQYNLKYRFDVAEDYDLWVRAAAHTQFANIPEVLTYYRVHDNQLTRSTMDMMDRNVRMIRLDQLERFGIKPTMDELDIHNACSSFQFQANRDFMKRVQSWLHKLLLTNQNNKFYPTRQFNRVLSERWWCACQATVTLGIWVFYEFWKSPLSRSISLSIVDKTRFSLDCLRHNLSGLSDKHAD